MLGPLIASSTTACTTAAGFRARWRTYVVVAVVLLVLTAVRLTPGVPTLASKGSGSPAGVSGSASTVAHRAMASVGSDVPVLPHRHSSPIPFGGPAFNGHYYSGTVYSGVNGTATDIRATMTVPRDLPESTDAYYVLTSVWDDAGSYDQVGFTSWSGAWGASYSTTTPCAASYIFSTDAYNLTGGATYVFEMRISSGVVTFSVAPVGSAAVWSLAQTTGGQHFVIQQVFTCSGTPSLDYTDYEEVYQTVAPVPPYPFHFSDNRRDGNPVTSWTLIGGSQAPPSITTLIDHANVTIANVPYALRFPPTLTTELSGAPRTYSATVYVDALGTGTSVTLSEVGTVIGLNRSSFSLSPASGTTPFVSNLSLRLAAGTTGAGGYPIRIFATDSSGSFARLGATAAVHASLNASIPVLYPVTADLNQSLSFSEVPAGGAGPFSFNWSGLPTGCASLSGYFSCSPLVAGSWTIAVHVVDSLGFSSLSPSVPLTVSPALSATLVANLTSVDIGQWIGFTLSATGGSGGNHVSWQGGGTGCSLSANTYQCPATAAGPFQVSASVTDSNGVRVTAVSAHVAVSPDPSARVSVDHLRIDVGAAFVVQASATGGSGGLRFTWHGLPADCSGGNASSVTCRTAAVGAYAVSVSVVDSNGFVNLSRAAVVTVNTDPAVRLVGSGSSLLAGDGFTLTAELSGGSGGWTFRWSGLPPDCPSLNNATVSCASTTAGRYAIQVVVTDATKTNATASFELTVAPALLGLPELEGAGVVVLGVGLVSLALALTIRRLRRPPSTRAPGDRYGPFAPP